MIVKFKALGQHVGLKVWGLGLAISTEVVEGLGFRTQQWGCPGLQGVSIVTSTDFWVS